MAKIRTYSFMMALLIEFISVADQDEFEENIFRDTCNHHINAVRSLSRSNNSILVKSAMPALIPDDMNLITKFIQQKSTAKARASRNTVTKEVRAEWREYAKANWANLEKPNNQVGNMANLIKQSVDSARLFKADTIRDNIKGIKKLVV